MKRIQIKREEEVKIEEKRRIVNGKIEITKNFLTLGIDIDTIVKSTDLNKKNYKLRTKNKRIVWR